MVSFKLGWKSFTPPVKMCKMFEKHYLWIGGFFVSLFKIVCGSEIVTGRGWNNGGPPTPSFSPWGGCFQK